MVELEAVVPALLHLLKSHPTRPKPSSTAQEALEVPSGAKARVAKSSKPLHLSSRLGPSSALSQSTRYLVVLPAVREAKVAEAAEAPVGTHQ